MNIRWKNNGKTGGALWPIALSGVRKRPFCAPEKILLTLLVYLCLAGTLPCGSCRAETVMIPMKFRNAGEALSIVRDLIAPGGKAAVDVPTNSLVISGDEEAIGTVRGFLARFDAPVPQATVRIRFRETLSGESSSWSAGGRVSGDGWSLGNGRRGADGIGIRLNHKGRRNREDSGYFIRVLSGSWAYILVGKDILFRERWRDLYRRYVPGGERVTIRRIETGMEVKPVIVGNRANLEILPRISHEVPGGRSRIIRFAEASTRISVSLDRWVDIGGTETRGNDVTRAILEGGRREAASALLMSLMVESTPEKN